MSTQTAVLEAATIRQQCKALHLPSVAAHCAQLAEQAARERRTHLGYLKRCCKPSSRTANTGWWGDGCATRTCRG
jgi:hypothetical protein